MFLQTLKGATAVTAAVLVAGLAANANTAAPRGAQRPAAQNATVHPEATPGLEQVLLEGGTLAANYYGNVGDIVGLPIACTTPGTDRDCTAETGLPAKAVTTLQYLYAATGTGGAQLDFVSQQTGIAKKTASTYPEFADTFDSYSNVTPIGYTKGWAGTAASTVEEDTIHAGAGDAPLPLGPSEGTGFTPNGFSVYADSFASYDGNGDTNGSGFNTNRGPARVVPILGTGVRIIFNTSNLTYTAPLKFTQNDLCGIFTGDITNFSATSANPGSQPITIIHRSDGSGTSFLTAYDLSQMCGPNNPFHGTGAPTSATFWNQAGLTQGVGTDSKVLSSAGVLPTDSGAPEIAWPNTSLGASKSAGVINAVAYGLEENGTTLDGNSCTAAGAPTPGDTCTNPAGYVGYVTPSDVLSGPEDEAAIENYKGDYFTATGGSTGTIETSLDGTTTSDSNPPAYPADNKTTILYFPFPTADGYPIVGYTYGYFYTCYPTAEKDQATGVKDFFGYGDSTSATNAAAINQALVARFWDLAPLGTAEKKNLASAVGFKTAPVTKGTSYLSPVNGAKLDYTCTDTNT